MNICIYPTAIHAVAQANGKGSALGRHPSLTQDIIALQTSVLKLRFMEHRVRNRCFLEPYFKLHVLANRCKNGTTVPCTKKVHCSKTCLNFVDQDFRNHPRCQPTCLDLLRLVQDWPRFSVASPERHTNRIHIYICIFNV